MTVLTARHITLIQHTFHDLIPQDPEMEVFFGDIFYRKLFAINPELRPLFHIGIAEQAHRLVTMLRWMVEHIPSEQDFHTQVAALGTRHVGYGVLPEHYMQVGEALIWVFQETMAEDFTPELKQAWLEVFQTITETMQGQEAPR